jgi:hypothetical protein
MFRHAPISASSMAVSGLVSFVASRSLAAVSSSRRGGGSFWAQLPFPLAGSPDLFSGVCVLIVFFHMRTLERRWGSSSFLTFLLWISVVNYVTAVVLFGIRPGTVSALLAPVVALALRYYLEMPAIGTSRLGPIAVTDKFLLIGAVAKLLLFPGAHVAEASLWTRLGIGLIGAIASYFGRRSASFALPQPPQSRLHQVLEGLERRVVRPVWDGLLVLPFKHSLAVPRVVRRKPMPRVDPEAVPNEVLDQIAAMEGRPRGRMPQTGPPTPAVNPQPAPVRTADPSLVQTIEELNLGASREEIMHALEMTGGNVDNAVAILLGGAD